MQNNTPGTPSCGSAQGTLTPKAEPVRCNVCGLADPTGTLVVDFVTYYGHKSAAICRDELLLQRDDARRLLGVAKQAMKIIANSEQDMCGRCEGSGTLSSDGQAHSQSAWQSCAVQTRSCPQCGGSGKIPNESAPDVARSALSEIDAAQKGVVL